MIHINTINKNYSIIIKDNIIDNIKDEIDFSIFSKVVVLTDENLVKYGWLEKLNIKDVIIIPSGEEHKNIETVIDIWKKMNDFKMDRKSLLLNLGGGVICDLGAFCASTYMRGINFIQIPTTLLSQVDASVGGKAGFNFNGGKNIIGSFTTPLKVLIDINTLKNVF